MNFSKPHRSALDLRNTDPGEMPIEQAAKFIFIVSLKTAREFGITLPQSILYRATDVIE